MDWQSVYSSAWHVISAYKFVLFLEIQVLLGLQCVTQCRETAINI